MHRGTVNGLLIFIIYSFTAISPASATDAEIAVTNATDAENVATNAIDDPILAKNTNTFLGLSFGVGLSLTIDTGGAKDRVESAEIIDGIVRITEEHNTIARILLESHYFFQPNGSFLKLPSSKWGHGPFVAIQPGETNTIDATGAGWMIGFKRNNHSSWNFGIGFIVDPNARVLGDGLQPNEPTNETQIRYKTETETGILILSSFGF